MRSREEARRYPQKGVYIKLDPDVHFELMQYCKARNKKVSRFISDIISSSMNSLALYSSEEYARIFPQRLLLEN